jgi:hypothetical protein
MEALISGFLFVGRKRERILAKFYKKFKGQFVFGKFDIKECSAVPRLLFGVKTRSRQDLDIDFWSRQESRFLIKILTRSRHKIIHYKNFLSNKEFIISKLIQTYSIGK